MIDQIVNCIKTNKLIPINYTSKFNTFHDVMSFIEKRLDEEKYKNVVFIVETDKIPTDTGRVSFQEMLLEQVPEEDRYNSFVVLMYKCTFNLIRADKKMLNLKKINSFLNCGKERTKFTCCICFDIFGAVRACPTCEAHMCEDCYKTLIKTLSEKLEVLYDNDITDELEVTCPCCRKTIHTIYVAN